MPVDASEVPLEEFGGAYVVDTELYKPDLVDYREVPVVVKDIFGRKSRIEMKRMSPYEYRKWLKDDA